MRISKIAIVIPSEFPLVGGFENSVYELAEELGKKALVQIVCTRLNKSRDIPQGVSVFPILRNMVINPIIVFNYLRKERPDVIHAHPCYPSGLFTLSGRVLGIPIVCTSHGDDIQIDWSVGYGVRRKRLPALLVRIALLSASIHTLPSKSLISDAIEAGSSESKIRVIQTGIDIDEVPRPRVSAVSGRFGIQTEDFLILFLGRLHPKKCPMDLVSAFPIIKRRIANAKLVLAGSGPEELRLRESVSASNLSDSVVFAGFVSDEEKWSLLRRCQVFVLPSAVEGHPRTLNEAMMCERPVVVTDVGPFPEIIRDHENGILVRLHDVDAIAEAVVELYSDSNLSAQLGKRGREDVEKWFNSAKIADDYFKTYSEAVRMKHPHG